MRIALISFEFWYNYGTCLQAYALQTAVRTLGCEAEYLDVGWKYPISPLGCLLSGIGYKRPHIALYHRLGFLYVILRNILISRSRSPIRRLRVVFANNRAFERFKDEYLRIVSSGDLQCANRQYDYFMVGSDQTWNSNCVNNRDFLRFLLDFVQDDDKKICYAPSIGMTAIDDDTRLLFKKYLSTFKALSCREKRGARLISEATGCDVVPVLDPTLLLGVDEWRKVEKPISTPKRFVLCYILGSKTCVVEYARELARKTNAELVVLSNNERIIAKYDTSIIKGVGPSEFVYLIDSAEEVVTDSFHGTAFAVNFEKSVHSFMKRAGTVSDSDNSRIGDLLDEFRLSNRFRRDDAEIDLSACDFTEARKILKEKRLASRSYLLSALGFGGVGHEVG